MASITFPRNFPKNVTKHYVIHQHVCNVMLAVVADDFKCPITQQTMVDPVVASGN